MPETTNHSLGSRRSDASYTASSPASRWESSGWVIAGQISRVIGLRRKTNLAVAGVDQVYSPDQLHAFLGQSDVVVIAAPLNEQTRGVIDECALGAMKPGAFLIVVSRGGHR